jgi:hypothetical protein
MSSNALIPPLRELPPGRSAERARHLRAEIARQRRPVVAVPGRRRVLFAAVFALALFGVLLVTPAFGLRDRIVHIFAAGDNKRPPQLIQRYFRNLDVAPGTPSGVIPGKARVAIELSVPGYGRKTLWVAPTRNGGFCTTGGCDRDRRTPFYSTLAIAGPTSRNSAPMPGSPHVHVFFEGDTLIHGAARVAVRFEDGSSERTPLVWVSRPIDAGFFLYELPKAHWQIGKRPVALAVENAHGEQLARITKVAAYFRDAQRVRRFQGRTFPGFAPPSAAGSSHRFLWIVLAAVVLLAAALGLAFLRPSWARRA